MPVDVHLTSGLVLRDAGAMLVEKFRYWPWDRYDGNPPRDPNVIDPGPDVDRVYKLGARTPRSAYVTLIDEHRERLSECLRSIPTDIALEDADLESMREPIVELFDLVSRKHLKMAGATKLLFPFRPRLFAVIDSVIDEYYWFATSIGDEPTFRRLGTIDDVRGEYIFELLRLMRADVDGARSQIDAALAECSGHAFSKVSRVRALDSLIWHCYARAGSTGADAVG